MKTIGETRNKAENFKFLYPFDLPLTAEADFLLVSEGTSLSVTGSKVVASQAYAYAS